MAGAGTDALEQIAHAAIDLAKVGAWQRLFNFLDEHENLGLGVVVNTRPSQRLYGILHQAAWHGNATACKRLVQRCRADPSLLTKDEKRAAHVASERGFTKLAEKLRGYEESRSDVVVTISVLLPSGELLLENESFRGSESMSIIMKIADKNLCAKGLEGNVSALCSADGTLLDDNVSLLTAAVVDGSTLTAVVSDGAESLHIIEGHFHELIMKMNGCSGNPSELTDKNFTFPSLKAHVEELGIQMEYYAVPGMYGGFNTRVVREKSGWTLRCRSWSRVCEGSERSHKITVAGVVEILDEYDDSASDQE